MLLASQHFLWSAIHVLVYVPLDCLPTPTKRITPIQEGLCLYHPPQWSQCLAKWLVYSKCLISVCWMNERVSKSPWFFFSLIFPPLSHTPCMHPLHASLVGEWAFVVAQTVKHLPAMLETWVQSPGWEDPLEKEMATHSSILAWKIPWMEESGGLQSPGSQRVRHDWASSHASQADLFLKLPPFLFSCLCSHCSLHLDTFLPPPGHIQVVRILVTLQGPLSTLMPEIP